MTANNQINQHLVKVLIYNVQTVTPLTTNLQNAAKLNNIPIVPVSETMPEGKTYQTWMLDQLNAAPEGLRWLGNGSKELLVIFLDHACVSLGGMPILQDVSLSIHQGEFIVILGPNGAGKTTLIKLLLGLVKPSAGSVRVLGRRLGAGCKRSDMFPSAGPWTSSWRSRARDLVGFGLDGHRWGIGLPSRAP